ncbi:hypothetical protein [Pseudoduganella umbonata]|uniref:Uncharacterized protein n=1 Tax=Pseudoduganella umbonata TaxID=864828 RepID=A0A4P8HJ50_9BURK|nr:hypothetical protein [Pseudoduganella umbonata]MBB3219540.1 hypothetical protein [Pseudoduganella umbonata]QCP09613.1 hypothetical protein FCL38_03650 [Pseudoduganella umbonata]
MSSSAFRTFRAGFQMKADATMCVVRRVLAGLVLLACFASPAFACLLITSNRLFDRSVPDTFQWDKARMNRALPAPKLKTARIDRDPDIPTSYVRRIESCRSGMVSVWIRWPRAGKTDIDKTGFQFKLLSPDSGLSVDDVPVIGVREGDAIRFQFLLFESPYAAKDPLEVKMQVYAVNDKRQRGPASTLALRAPPACSTGSQR